MNLQRMSLLSTVALLAIVIVVAPVEVSAKGCRPDVSSKDRITKQQIDEWSLLASRLDTDSYIQISITIGRFGSDNRLNIVLEKSEANPGPAVFASAHTDFLFGFTDGEPMRFTSDRVVKDTRPPNVFEAAQGNVSRVTLIATIKDEDLPALKVALTSKPLDAVRVVMANDLTIESPVKRQNSARFREKLLCFFEHVEGGGTVIDLTTQNDPCLAHFKVDGSVDSGLILETDEEFPGLDVATALRRFQVQLPAGVTIINVDAEHAIITVENKSPNSRPFPMQFSFTATPSGTRGRLWTQMRAGMRMVSGTKPALCSILRLAKMEPPP